MSGSCRHARSSGPDVCYVLVLMRIAVSAISLAALSLLAACEIQPAPPRPAGSPAPSPTPPAPTPAPTPPPATIDAGTAPAVRQLPPITPRCLEVARHVANVIIASAEPSQRAIFEAERDRIERSTGDVCTAQAWSEPAMTCYLAAKTQPELKACEAKFPMQPRPPAPAAPAAAPARGADGKLTEPGTPVAQPPRATPARPAKRPAPAPPAKPAGGGLMPPRSTTK